MTCKQLESLQVSQTQSQIYIVNESLQRAELTMLTIKSLTMSHKLEKSLSENSEKDETHDRKYDKHEIGYPI